MFAIGSCSEMTRALSDMFLSVGLFSLFSSEVATVHKKKKKKKKNWVWEELMQTDSVVRLEEECSF